ncbi:MAG: hypothetical protein LUD76_10240 [Alistipes sp.]|nr:hypothetical protein [Alistipes sp.]
MAKASWCTTNPSSGSGNGTVNIGGSEHTGRTQRTTTVTFKATGVADKPVAVTQLAKPEFVNIANITEEKQGGTVTMTGSTNSSKLTFSLGTNNIGVTLPGSYSAGGGTTNNGADISGDPGATAQFAFSIQFTVPANPTINERATTVIVTAAGGQSASGTITQAAGDPTLSVSPTSVQLAADGTAVAISVESNTEWTVE